MQDAWSTPCANCFTCEERPSGVHCTGGWVGLRVRLYLMTWLLEFWNISFLWLNFLVHRNEANPQYFNQIPTLWFYNAIYFLSRSVVQFFTVRIRVTNLVTLINPLKPELNSICYLLALLGAHHFLHVSRIRVKLLTFRRLMSFIYIYIYGAPILDVSRSHTTTQHSR